MELKWSCQKYVELDVYEAYEIMRLRNAVFVVEQNCAYQDLDYKDYQAMHLLGWSGKRLAAYTRLFDKGTYYKDFSSLGRVVVEPEFRGKGLAHSLMVRSFEEIKRLFGNGLIKISAQMYLTRFYEEHGFYQTGESYLEDGIPHICMIKKISDL